MEVTTMTQQQAVHYALECKRAKAAGLPKPPRPDNATTTSSLLDIHKELVKTRTTLEVLEPQIELVTDYLFELRQRSPEAWAYAELMDSIFSQLLQMEARIKAIR
jgi:hypothetical protein